MPANRVCMDLDNCLKVAIDALKGICYIDDSQVRKIIAERAEPDGQARLVVTISEYVPPMAGLFEGMPGLPQPKRAEAREPEGVPF